MLAAKSIFSGSKDFHTHRPKKKTLQFNFHPEPRVEKSLQLFHFAVACWWCSLVRQVWQGHRDSQLTSFAREWDLCDREAGLPWVASIFVFGYLGPYVVLN